MGRQGIQKGTYFTPKTSMEESNPYMYRA